MITATKKMTGKYLLYYFKLTTYAMVGNFKPAFTLILGLLILNEGVTSSDITQIIICVAATILITCSMLHDKEKIEE